MACKFCNSYLYVKFGRGVRSVLNNSALAINYSDNAI